MSSPTGRMPSEQVGCLRPPTPRSAISANATNSTSRFRPAETGEERFRWQAIEQMWNYDHSFSMFN